MYAAAAYMQYCFEQNKEFELVRRSTAIQRILRTSRHHLHRFVSRYNVIQTYQIPLTVCKFSFTVCLIQKLQFNCKIHKNTPSKVYKKMKYEMKHFLRKTNAVGLMRPLLSTTATPDNRYNLKQLRSIILKIRATWFWLHSSWSDYLKLNVNVSFMSTVGTFRNCSCTRKSYCRQHRRCHNYK